MSISSLVEQGISSPTHSTILLTGATGYIGSVVAERLLAAGYRVRGLVRSEISAQKAALRGIDPWLGNLSDATSLEKAVAGVDAVIHTAALGGPAPGQSFEEAVAEAVTTLDVLRSLTAVNKIRLISTSGASLYGDTGEHLIDESFPSQVPPFLQSLADMENQLIHEASHVHVLRTSMVYGRAGGSGILAILKGVKARGQAVFVNDVSELSFVHVEDLADLYLTLLQSPDAPPLTLAASQIVSAKDFIAAAAVAAGVATQFEQISAEEAVSTFGDIGFYLARNMRISDALALRDLNWSPSRTGLVDELKSGSYRHALF